MLGPAERQQVWLRPWSNFPPDFSPDCRRNSWWPESLQIFPVLKTGICPNQIPPFPGGECGKTGLSRLQPELCTALLWNSSGRTG